MEFETIDVVLDGGLGRLTLNRPEHLNPLGSHTLAELAQAARWLDDQGAVVVIVSGAGDRAFTAGFDIHELRAPRPDQEPAGDLGYRMAEAIEAMDAVTIAAIGGHCIGGGVVLAAACDLRIAADDARFAIPEVDLGMPLTWGGIPRLVREIGPAMTRELVMTCRPFDAHEARTLGFVNRVVPRAELMAAADDLAAAILDKEPALIRTTKRQVHVAAEDLTSTRNAWQGTLLLRALAQVKPPPG